MKLFELHQYMLKNELSNLSVSEQVDTCGSTGLRWLDLFNNGVRAVCCKLHIFTESKVFTSSTTEVTKTNFEDPNYIVALVAYEENERYPIPINHTFAHTGIRTFPDGKVEIPKTQQIMSICVEYAVYPELATANDLNEEIKLPDTVIKLVVAYIAHHYHNAMNSENNIMMARSYADAFNRGIDEVTNRNSLGLSEAGHDRFSQSGFV